MCPAEFNIGEDARIAILSIPEGDDKVEKYPLMFATSDALVINKYDMLPHFEFDEQRVSQNAADLNPRISVFGVSSRSGVGVDELACWLTEKVNNKINA